MIPVWISLKGVIAVASFGLIWRIWGDRTGDTMPWQKKEQVWPIDRTDDQIVNAGLYIIFGPFCKHGYKLHQQLKLPKPFLYSTLLYSALLYDTLCYSTLP